MGTLKDRLQQDLTDAMKRRDELEVSTLRMVRAAILNAQVAGAQAVELADAEIVTVLRSEAKRRAEAADIYEGAGRPESAAKERGELAIIERYLPAVIGDEALAELVTAAVAEAAAAGQTGPKAMGAVVRAVRERAGEGVDGGKVAGLVKAALAGAGV